MNALAAHADLIGKSVRIAGKLQIDHSDQPPRNSVVAPDRLTTQVRYGAQRVVKAVRKVGRANDQR